MLNTALGRGAWDRIGSFRRAKRKTFSHPPFFFFFLLIPLLHLNSIFLPPPRPSVKGEEGWELLNFSGAKERRKEREPGHQR